MHKQLDEEMRREFLWTAREEATQLEVLLTQPNTALTAQELHDEIARHFHSIKSSAGVLRLRKLQKVAHASESLLELLIEDPSRVSDENTDFLLHSLDGIRALLNSVESAGTEEDVDITEFLRVNKARTRAIVSAPAEASASQTNAATPGKVATQPGTQVAKKAKTASTDIVAAASKSGAIVPVENGGRAEILVRVSLNLLDEMMTLVGELVLARNQLLRSVSIGGNTSDSALATASELIDSCTSALQEKVVRTRMQPISNIFDKFPRIVRDLAQQLGKRIELEVIGGNVELDRNILEAVRDPFTHLLRNCVDHAIEKPDVRLENGKFEQGFIRIRASHEAGQVVVRIEDDGAGINVEKVVAKAIANGVITAEEAARLSHQEALNLICSPGLSTAAVVSNISGRGVGMDVVKRNIESLRGTVNIASELGRGTTMTIRLPLTLAIIDGFLVRCGTSSFVIPLEHVEECIDGTGAIASGTAVGVINQRDVPLPIISISQLLGLRGLPLSRQSIVVVSNGDARAGLLVDHLLGEYQTVIKPLGELFKHLRFAAGSTILGSGEVALILDTAELIQRATQLVRPPTATRRVRALPGAGTAKGSAA